MKPAAILSPMARTGATYFAVAVKHVLHFWNGRPEAMKSNCWSQNIPTLTMIIMVAVFAMETSRLYRYGNYRVSCINQTRVHT